MRKLFILQGLPASGKSTFIRDIGAQNNVISFDHIREVFSINAHDAQGDEVFSIRKSLQGRVAKIAQEAAEYRMSNGETLFIDNTNTTSSAIKPWVVLAKKYGYTPYVLSFRDSVGLDVAIDRDRYRVGRQHVGENTIKRMHKQLMEYREYGGVDHIYTDHTNFILNELSLPVENLNHYGYEEVVVVGDVQGCGNALESLFNKIGPLEDKSRKWIFVGDLFDRGKTPEKVLDFMTIPRANVTIVEGNHERSVRQTLLGVREFPQSKETINLIPKEKHKSLLKLVSRPKSAYFFRFGDNTAPYIVTHAGINPDAFGMRLSDWYLPPKDMNIMDSRIITGLNPDYDYYMGSGSREKAYFNIGSYDDFMGDLNKGVEDSIFKAQFFGHRNDFDNVEEPRSWFPNLVPLENKVEFDGTLVAAIISKDGTIRYEHTTEK